MYVQLCIPLQYNNVLWNVENVKKTREEYFLYKMAQFCNKHQKSTL